MSESTPSEEADSTDRTGVPEPWPDPEFSNPAIAGVRGVFVLTDGARLYEEYDGCIVKGSLLAARDWRGPSVEYDPFADEDGDRVLTYEVQAPGGAVFIPKANVETILTAEDLESAAAAKTLGDPDERGGA
jgi:hypothetical protein